MSDLYKEFLQELGYNVNSKGVIYFCDLIDDVRNLLKENKSFNEIKEVLPSYYLEYYHFFYEVPRATYLKELEQFCNSRKISEKNELFNMRLMPSVQNMNVENSLFYFANYFNQLELEQENLSIEHKVLQKNLQCSSQ